MQTLGGQQLVTGRVEKIRGLRFATRSDGFDITSRVGDGALPLEANVDIDGLPDTGDLLKATATVSPLPSEIDVNLFNGTKGDLTDPFRVVYTSSDGVDVDPRGAAGGRRCRRRLRRARHHLRRPRAAPPPRRADGGDG